MATKKSRYSAGAKKMILKADEYLRKPDGKSETVWENSRNRNGAKAGLSLMEQWSIKGEAGAIRDKAKKANSVPGRKNIPKDSIDKYVSANKARGTQSGHATKRKSK